MLQNTSANFIGLCEKRQFRINFSNLSIELCKNTLESSVSQEQSQKFFETTKNKITCDIRCSFQIYDWRTSNTSVIRQKGESQNGRFKKTKQDKFSEKQTFLISFYAPPFALLPTNRYTTMLIMLWDFSIFYQIFFSRQMKWTVFLSNKRVIYFPNIRVASQLASWHET